MTAADFFDALWTHYAIVTPQASAIHKLFESEGERVVNDHVAFRTFNIAGYGLDSANRILNELGYCVFESYVFPKKYLRANAFMVPDDLQAPKIFFSELQIESLSLQARAIILDMTENLHADLVLTDLFGTYPFKRPTYEQYKALADESEYAAWLLTMGYQANHFTVNINGFERFRSMENVIDLLRKNGFSLNEAGGLIKGTPNDLLIQASTTADQVFFEFADGEILKIPGCFYEFAHRFKDKAGDLFMGFVPSNANTIFESTNRQAQ